MKRILTQLLAATIACSALAQGQAPTGEQSTTVAKGQVFSQPSFRLELPLPDGWHIASREVRDFRKMKAMDITKMDEETRAYTQQRVRRLLVVQKFPSGTARGKNTSLSINSTHAGQALEGMTAVEYQNAVVSQLLSSGMKAEVLAKPAEAKLGGRSFSTVETKLSFQGFTIYQRQYDCFDGEYILNIQIAAPSQEELIATDKLIQKIVFDKGVSNKPSGGDGK